LSYVRNNGNIKVHKILEPYH
ncbi:hypothetical protein, partial [Plasmodium yoelii yoelii]